VPEPRDEAERIEAGIELPPGSEERFSGYGIMGLPFQSGHVLALRRFVVTSVGPAYTSVWHRNPAGDWTFYQNVPPHQACPRFFGSDISAAHLRDIDLTWTGPRDLDIRVRGDDGVQWSVRMEPTLMTRLMSAVGSVLPAALWKNGPFLSVMSAVAGPALGVGKVGLLGRVPNRQEFIANPLRMWTIPESRAIVRAEDIGPVGPLPDQAHLADFYIPNRGIFAVGHAFFEPLDESRHATVTSRAG
jgi:hypothetical protein